MQSPFVSAALKRLIASARLIDHNLAAGAEEVILSPPCVLAAETIGDVIVMRPRKVEHMSNVTV